MTRPDPHDLGELSAYAFGLLDAPAARAVEQHLRSCAGCREQWSELRGTTALLEDVPPEMFLDGPPDGELMLRRTLREVRTEKARARRSQRFRMVAVAAAALVVLVGGGVVVGRVTAPETVAVALPAGSRTLQGSSDGPSGPITMSADVVPAAGWVRLAAMVTGIPPGERCTLLVVAKDGSEHEGGSWIVAPRGQAVAGATINGSAIVAPEDVAAVRVRNDEGRTFITLPA